MLSLKEFFHRLSIPRFPISNQAERANGDQTGVGRAREPVPDHGYNAEHSPTCSVQSGVPSPSSQGAAHNEASGRLIKETCPRDIVVSAVQSAVNPYHLDQIVMEHQQPPLPAGSSEASRSNAKPIDYSKSNNKNNAIRAFAALCDPLKSYESNGSFQSTWSPDLDEQDMRVISGLFSHPELPPAPNEIRWKDFTRTMTHLGFGIRPRRRGGASRRLFVGIQYEIFPAGSHGHVITVHEPHPRISLDLSEVREIGRRLTNAFGWSAETFLSVYHGE
ncbi:hypothetical protein F4777DRAFT_596033 [Nemania sp. FL0916]|nr:hypothetical protein F4777DRAFT_596033 [Nemania sp. FL0916]